MSSVLRVARARRVARPGFGRVAGPRWSSSAHLWFVGGGVVFVASRLLVFVGCVGGGSGIRLELRGGIRSGKVDPVAAERDEMSKLTVCV